MMRLSDAERIATLESQMKSVIETLEKNNEKLDDLLQIKYKGIGAFWLASTIIGTGIIGLITQLSSWWNS